MIELAKLQSLSHIVAHENCADGIISAMILKHVLPAARVTFCQYETPLHKTIPAEPGMIFCDFSPHLSRVQEFLDVETIVLDHHGGPAGEATRAFVEKGLGAFADMKQDVGVSGALLAYQNVWLPLWGQILGSELENSINHATRNSVQSLAELAGVRDTWQTKDPRWPQACEVEQASRFWPWTIMEKAQPNTWWSEIYAIGPVLSAKNAKTVEKCIENAHRFKTKGGRNVLVFEGLKPSSDVSEAVGSGALVIGFGFTVEGGVPKMIFSSRSKDAFNCRNLALAHGGGGHVAAAGFSLELELAYPNPYVLVERVLQRYEAYEEEWDKITAQEDFGKRVKDGLIIPKQAFDELTQPLSAWLNGAASPVCP